MNTSAEDKLFEAHPVTCSVMHIINFVSHFSEGDAFSSELLLDILNTVNLAMENSVMLFQKSLLERLPLMKISVK